MKTFAIFTAIALTLVSNVHADSDKLNNAALHAISIIENATGTKMQTKFVNGGVTSSFDGSMFLNGPELLAYSYIAEDLKKHNYSQADTKAFLQPRSIDRSGGLSSLAKDGSSTILSGQVRYDISIIGNKMTIMAVKRDGGQTLWNSILTLNQQDAELHQKNLQFAETGTAAAT